mmetsp:Transcript_18581/g.47758  ORF Transcript_18581/g.47758 Transcript_18581/m.47758 type:complete len:214 (+) Transcript_18581:671-1312(+)
MLPRAQGANTKQIVEQLRVRWWPSAGGLPAAMVLLAGSRTCTARRQLGWRSVVWPPGLSTPSGPSRKTDHLRSWPHGCMSYSPSSSSNSPSSSAVASWYCWYSETRSFMLLSASVNSISSMPSPVYQCRKALRRNIDVKYSATRLNISWIAVELPAKATAIFRPFGGMSQIEALMLFGIHSTKYEEFLFCTFNICSSTSFVDMRPRKSAAAVR